MNLIFIRRSLQDALCWGKHRLAYVAFARAGGGASGWVAWLLVAPLWFLFAAWVMTWVSWAFASGVDGFRFACLVVATAVPYELLARWWRKLSRFLPREYVEKSLSLFRAHAPAEVQVFMRNRHPAWCPVNLLESWMVVWAFDPEYLRDACGSRLRLGASTVSRDPPIRRL